jgi:hypothetical protein
VNAKILTVGLIASVATAPHLPVSTNLVPGIGDVGYQAESQPLLLPDEEEMVLSRLKVIAMATLLVIGVQKSTTGSSSD